MTNYKGVSQGFFITLLVFLFMYSSASWAGSIENLSLLDSEDGDVLIIESDSPLEYQVFDLTDPARLIMTFPGASINDSVVAIKGDGAGVGSLFPKVNELGVRIEIGLTEVLEYEVDEQDNSLIIRFEAAKSEEGLATKPKIEKLKVQDRSGVTEVIIDGVNMDGNHNVFMTNNNRSLVVDLWGAKSALGKEFYQYASQRVKSITVGSADDRLRLILDLTSVEGMAQQVEANKDRMVIRVGKIRQVSNATQVESVDFQPDGEVANIMIRTNVTNPVVDVFEKGKNTIIDIAGATLVRGQERTQDLSAFAGPISQVDAYKKGDKVRVVVRLREEVQVTTFQQGNALSLNFVPKALLERGKVEADGVFSYKGEKVTFDFKDIDIRNALKLIAEMSDLNIIMSEDVSGTLTMRLIDVPWDQALDLILSARGLGKEKSGNVLRVAPVEVLRKEYAAKIEARKGSLQLEELITAFITLNYTKVDDVKQMLDESESKKNASATSSTAKGAVPEADKAGLLSSRGSVLVDKRTNTLIVKDTLEAVNNIKRLIAAIDKPIQQVLIEARIVEASDNFTHSIGIRWGGNVNRETNYNFPGAVAIGAAGTTAENAGNIISGGQSAATNRGFLVDLPAAGNGGAIGLSLGSFSNAINLDLELSAAQADGNAKIISNPRIVTSNLTPATVTQGTLVPIVTPGSANQPATTELITAALTLKVTPQITADNGVILDVKVTKDSPTVFNGQTGIDSKAVTTNVYVKNGETIVIGGVYTREKADNVDGVPGLSEIPFLGWLFKTETTRDNKSELLIFITPKVMKGGAAAKN